MKLNNKMVKLVQSQLNQQFGLNLVEDGISGKATIAAINHIPTISSSWPDGRKFVAAIQYFATKANLNAGPIDGYWGPQTGYAYQELQELIENGRVDLWRDEEPPKYDWPRGRTADMNRFFGPVGTNMSKVSTPYTLKLAWQPKTTIRRFTCHRLVVDPIQEAMEEILDIYGLDFIEENKLDYWGGCLSVRKMRGGSNYSMHSWGAAVDINPAENRLRWGADKAQLAHPEFVPFWEAWERVGATSLGRAKGFDYMHVQFCSA